MENALDKMLEVRPQDFQALFDHVSHSVECTGVPSASLGLYYMRHDRAGKPIVEKVVHVLLNYLTQYCFSPSERRHDMSEVERNEIYQRARKLFRDTPDSGQAGEMLIYFLAESVLKAPQVLKKMPITTNTADERKGSDGVHARWIEEDELFEIIYCEAKIWSSFSAALQDAFKSMTNFHKSSTRELELRMFTASFDHLDDDLRSRVISYVDGENVGKSQEVHACLIGYDWNKYAGLDTRQKQDEFVHMFDDHYRNWATETMKPLVDKRAKEFPHKHVRLEFFFLPFPSVEAFRDRFNNEL